MLLVVFTALQARLPQPLLPLRILFDRTRGGSYLTVFILGVGMFGIFLFLTYYLQQNLGFSPVGSGLAFLPMMGTLMIAATTVSSFLLPRVGIRPLVAAGMLVAAAGMFGWQASASTAPTPPTSSAR